MGGEVTVEHLPDGSRWSSFTVPLSAAARPTASLQRVAFSALIGRRVLLVGPTPQPSTLARTLRGVGLEVEAVAAFEPALQALRVARDSGQPFDVAIVDDVPGRLDGFGFAKRAAADGGGAPAILLIAQTGQRGDADRCRGTRDRWLPDAAGAWR